MASTGYTVSDPWDLFKESKEELLSSRITISKNSASGYHFVAFVTQVPSIKDFDQGRVYKLADELCKRKLPENSVIVEENERLGEIDIAVESR